MDEYRELVHESVDDSLPPDELAKRLKRLQVSRLQYRVDSDCYRERLAAQRDLAESRELLHAADGFVGRKEELAARLPDARDVLQGHQAQTAVSPQEHAEAMQGWSRGLRLEADALAVLGRTADPETLARIGELGHQRAELQRRIGEIAHARSLPDRIAFVADLHRAAEAKLTRLLDGERPRRTGDRPGDRMEDEWDRRPMATLLSEARHRVLEMKARLDALEADRDEVLNLQAELRLCDQELESAQRLVRAPKNQRWFSNGYNGNGQPRKKRK